MEAYCGLPDLSPLLPRLSTGRSIQYTHISKVSVDSTVEWNVQMVDIDLVQWNVISVDSAVEKMFNLYSR